MIQIKFYGKFNRLEDCGYSLAEEEKIYNDQLQDIMDHTREYLDNLETMLAYRLSWNDYKTNGAVLPLKLSKSPRKEKPL